MMRLAGPALLAVALTVAPSSAGDNPFMGAWVVQAARVAPWIGPNDPTPPPNLKMLRTTFVFTPKSVTAPEPLGCAKAVYEFKTVGPEFLFEGGLAHPKEDARALGFTTDTFPAMSFSCNRPDADVSMDYALMDTNTIVFALDNYIYFLMRQPLR